MAGSHLKTGMQLSIILCTKSPHIFGLTASSQHSLATGLGRNETQRAHSILPSVFCVFPCNISSTATHALLSKADGQIGDMKNLPTAIAWACPWATGDNWSEISDQTGEASKCTQLETVYTELCKKRPVTLPSFVQSHSDAPRLVLSSKYSLICWEVFSCSASFFPSPGFNRNSELVSLQDVQNWGGGHQMYFTFWLPNRWAALESPVSTRKYKPKPWGKWAWGLFMCFSELRWRKNELLSLFIQPPHLMQAPWNNFKRRC